VKKNESSHKIYSIQMLRAVSAWLVVFHHYMQVFYNFNYDSIIGHFFSTVGHFGVDIFFVISGFVIFLTIEHKHYPAHIFFLNRILRVVPPYWVATIILVPIVSIFHSSVTELYFKPNTASLIKSLLFIPHQNPAGFGLYPFLTVGWTLNYEMLFYTFASVSLVLSQKRWFYICVVFLWMMPVFYKESWPYGAILSNSHLYEFIAGMIIAFLYLWLKRNRYEFSNRIWIGALGGVVLFLLGAAVYMSGHFRPLSAAIFVVSALSFERYCIATNSFLSWLQLGNMSYSTYLVHPLALIITVYFFGQSPPLLGMFFSLAAYIAITLTLSCLSYRWIETGYVMKNLKVWSLRVLSIRLGDRNRCIIP